MELFLGFTSTTIPMKPNISPQTCLKVIFSLSQKNAINIVIKAVEELRIASIFESDPIEATEKRIKGIAVLVRLKIRIYLKLFIKSFRSFGLIKRGRNTNDASARRNWTKNIAPSSGVAILMNINALPHIAPRKINNDQYLNSINKKTLKN